ncbi:MAG TPA: hypothetical protein VIK55_15120 [Paludibacter sp.]
MKSINPFLILTLTVAFLFTSCKNEGLPLVTQGILAYEVSNSNINRYCTSLFLQSKTIGYATTQEGEVFKTTDGGEKWNKLNISSPVPLSASYFLNKDFGYVFGGEAACSPSPCEPYGSVAYKTTNGGRTWQRQSIPYEWSKLYSAYIFSENDGIAVGLGLCIKTSNGGQTWQSFTIGKNNISKISFLNQNVGYALDLMGGFFKTEDGGQSWKDISINNEKMTFDFCFINETTGYANNSNKLLKTMDGGNSWNMIDTLENSVNSIYFVNEKSGMILSKKFQNDSGIMGISNPWKHVVKFTNDGGQTWTTKELEQEELNERCLFAKENIIYSLSYDKIIKLIIE